MKKNVKLLKKALSIVPFILNFNNHANSEHLLGIVSKSKIISDFHNLII